MFQKCSSDSKYENIFQQLSDFCAATSPNSYRRNLVKFVVSYSTGIPYNIISPVEIRFGLTSDSFVQRLPVCMCLCVKT